MQNQDKKEIQENEEQKKNLEEMEEWQKKAEEYLNGWKRCQADFENYKKHQVNSQSELLRFINEALILEILPILDNFYIAINHIPEDQKKNSWVIGIMHIQKQLENILKNNNVKEIETKEGDEFDPCIHEAIMNSKETKPEEKKNKIIEIIQKGYKLNDKIIRPTRVIVE